MRARTLAAVIAILLLALPSAAQEQRGTIEGVVKDASGAILPGVTVEAKAANGAVLSTTSDASGVYRFPSVAPGTYEINATLSSFAPGKVNDIAVGLGQIKKIDLTLKPAGLSETVQVTAESPLVDVRSNSRQTNIRAEQVDLLPHGRDFTTLVTQAPGANAESKLGGLSIDGASAGENRYIIDGIETTNLQSGLSGKNVIADFVDEVQVKSSGYTAEFGGATGGVINVLTKSGTNNIHGSGLFNWQGSKLSGGSVPVAGSTNANLGTGVPVLRLSLTNSDVAEYVTYPKDDENRVEPGFSVGGPISINKAWFFGAYQPAFTKTSRNVTAASSNNPNATPANISRTQQVQYITANQTSQLGQNLRTRIAFNNSWAKTKGLLPALAGTDLPDSTGKNYAKTSVFPNYSLSGNADWTVSPKFFVGARGGWYMSDQHDTDVTELVRYVTSTTSTSAFPEIPQALAMTTNFQNIPANQKVTRDQQTRAYFQADGTYFASGLGQHQIKFGTQFDRIGNDVFSGESRNLVTLRWNASLSTGFPVKRGTYGYYSVRSNAVAPQQGFITEGNVHTNVIALFVQDAWTIGNRLTVNAGIRTERERVPTYETSGDIPKFGIAFDFADKLAPRLGASYDLRGDGRTKVFGSWGYFYDNFKLELPRGSFGGDKWLEYYYTLDTFDWPNLVTSSQCPPACPGTLIRGPIDFRSVSLGSDAIDPDLKPMRLQEGTAGVEHQLNDRMALSVRYVHKQLDRAVEDTGSLDAQGNEIYVIANPGEGLTALASTNPVVSLPKAKRDYDSVEVAFEKRFSQSWYLRSSYLWSRLYGNYSGLSQSDENGRTAPNVGRLYDYPLMMFQDGGTPAFGPLATDRPSQFKTQFIYQFKFGTSVGANTYLASGLPVSRELGIYPTSNLPVQYKGRGSDGRTDVFSQTDLLVQHEFAVGTRRLQVSFNVLNLFNQEAAVSKYSTYQKINGVVPDETLFYTGQQTLESLIATQNVTKDARFLLNNGFQQPIQARFGVKFLF
jgi:hypothetical protein